MQSYFTAIQPHLEDRVDIAIVSTPQSPSTRSIASLGIDSLIYLRDLSTDSQNRIYLPETTSYHCIAEALTHDACLLGAESGLVQEFNLKNQQTKPIYKSAYKINSLANSHTKKYLAIASEESKCVLVDMHTLRASKCRPGHESGVANAIFSQDQKFIASIGMDKTLFIYNIQNFDQPIEKFHIKICKTQTLEPSLLRGSFHKLLHIFYAPGMKELQIVELLNDKWEYRMSKFVKHTSEPIQLVNIIKTSLMATGSASEFMIWNNKTEEKIVVLDNFTLNKIIEVNETFWGCKNDGRVFCYKKILNQVIGGDANQDRPQKMELEEQGTKLNIEKSNEDVLVFDDDAQEEEEQEGSKSLISEKLYEEPKKKSIADKLIKAYPQQAVSSRTSQFDNAYFLRTSHQGYLVFQNETEFEKRIDFEIEDKPTEHLFINKEILFCDFNSQFLLYANENEFGVKFLKTVETRCFEDVESWERHWHDVSAVACSYQWVAVANDEDIKILDVTGNELKSIAFDRVIVAMAAYQNLLAVVYHETIPIDGAQCLSMQLYVINHEVNEALKCSSCHVPVKRKALLKFFRFSSEGMLVAQDDAGYIRVYNLENNTWTSVIVEGVEDTRRIWLLGMHNFQLVYWRTSELNPDPVVFPRLPVKTSRLGASIALQDSQRMREYPFIMFQRFCLDHEKSRSRLWGPLKHGRNQKYPGYSQNISTIMTPTQIARHHNQLDFKFFEFIKFYLENPRTHQKALTAVKTLIRTIDVGKTFIDIFDSVKQRGLAVELEIYFQEKEKELQYEAMQRLELENLKVQAERTIKPKGSNNPFNRKKNNDFSSIPSLNTSQMSQVSNFDSLSERSAIKSTKENGMKMANKPPVSESAPKEKQEVVNPFLRKKTTSDDANQKMRQIEEQIEKHGIRKKADVPKKANIKF